MTTSLKKICSNTYQWPITPQKWAGVCVNHCLMQKEASLIRNKKYTNLYIGGSTDTNNTDYFQCFQCMHSFHTVCWYIVCLEIAQVLCILSQMLWVHMCTCPAVSRKKCFLVCFHRLWHLYSSWNYFINHLWALRGRGRFMHSI